MEKTGNSIQSGSNLSTLTYNPHIGLYLVPKSETWTIKIFGKNAFDFEGFLRKINWKISKLSKSRLPKQGQMCIKNKK